MKEIWIIGYGRFGSLAIERLGRRFETARFRVVDQKARLPDRDKDGRVRAVAADGIDFLAKNLRKDGPPDQIVPCVPVHAAWEWLRRQLNPPDIMAAQKVPHAFVRRLPHPMRGRDGAVYSSFADFICPDDCPEPATVCSVTKAPRTQNLFDLMASAAPPGFTSLVIRSRQLAPGVGGYAPADLFDALNRATKAENRVILSTACRCHGVSHAFGPPE